MEGFVCKVGIRALSNEASIRMTIEEMWCNAKAMPT